MKYGLAEISMVVLGILIALQINNWNEKRKDNHKILKILTEMQQDLWDDIQGCDKLIDWAENVDSLAAKIIAGEIHDSTYRKAEKRHLFKIGTATYPLVVTDIGFQKLARFSGEIPDTYSDIIDKSNRLYIEEKMYIGEAFKRFNDYTIENYNAMYRDFDWMEDLEKGNITPKILAYFQDDPIYKSQMIRYKDILNKFSQGNASKFKVKSILLYFDIEKITQANKVPSGLVNFAPATDSSSFAPYIGKYADDADDENPVTVVQKEGRLYISNRLLFYIAPDSFHLARYADDYNVYFPRNDSSEVTGVIFDWGGQRYETKKLE
ncbi:MAG: DUF6090 family protein [Bacteroidia bacterium]